MGAILPALNVLAKYGLNIAEFSYVTFEEREAGVATIMVSGGNMHNEIIVDEKLRECILSSS